MAPYQPHISPSRRVMDREPRGARRSPRATGGGRFPVGAGIRRPGALCARESVARPRSGRHHGVCTMPARGAHGWRVGRGDLSVTRVAGDWVTGRSSDAVPERNGATRARDRPRRRSRGCRPCRCRRASLVHVSPGSPPRPVPAQHPIAPREERHAIPRGERTTRAAQA
jgi:hypothetical protein